MDSQTKVLLVDDEAEIRISAEMWMQNAGFDTLTARDGIEVLALAADEQPAAIVMDVRMPQKNGLVALAELKQHDRTRNIPVVMLSASIIDQERALDSGACCFLTKPYDGRTLVKVVKSMISAANSNSTPTRHLSLTPA